MFASFLYTLFIWPIAEIIEIVFTVLYRIVDDYGLAIIGLSFAITFLTLPIYMVAENWQEVERKKVASMEPKVRKIKQAFKGDERFMILSAYYREQHYKPIYALRSSFSILIQVPFFFAAYNFLSAVPALKGYSFLFLKDLGSPDGLLHLGEMSYNLLPIVMTLANMVSGSIYSKGHPLREKVQIYGLAVVFLVLLYDRPSGLLLYWTLNNVLSLVKNIFYKLKHPAKVLYLLISFLLGVWLLFVFMVHSGRASTRLALTGIVILLWLLPVELRIMKGLYHTTLQPLSTDKKTRDGLFLLSMAGLVVLLGLFVPLDLIVSSPTEFAFLKPYRSPLVFVGMTLTQAIGFFLIWGVMLYGLFGRPVQTYAALSGIWLFLVAIVNLFFFNKSFGSVALDLQFANPVKFGAGDVGVNALVQLPCSWPCSLSAGRAGCICSVLPWCC